MFRSDKEYLSTMLRNIHAGAVQLPDFQREWVWDENHITSLLASVSLSYPVGAVMTLANGNNGGIRFAARPIEGVILPAGALARSYILDGQQRLTSLYQATMMSSPATTKDIRKNVIKRWFYFDMARALDATVDREEAIRSLPEDRKVRDFRNTILEDYSVKHSEYEKGLFPLAAVFDSSLWRQEYGNYWKYDPTKTAFFDRFEREVIEKFKLYQIPVIEIQENTPKEAVCQVFEKVNTGGVVLTVFELLTAMYAADNFNLRNDWEQKSGLTASSLGNVGKLLNSIQKDHLLQVVTLLATYGRHNQAKTQGVKDLPGISCKRKNILQLTLDEYNQWGDKAIAGLIDAGKFLYTQMVLTPRDVPYQSQLIPLAAIFAVLGNDAMPAAAKDKLTRWYWCGVLAELYGGAAESRFAQDLPQVVDWVRNGPNEPDTVTSANFFRQRLYTLRTRNSAAYKGIYALLLRDGLHDFISNTPVTQQVYFDDRIDIHHIFPQKWCLANQKDRSVWNSIINKTPLSAGTNRAIQGNAPSQYLATCQAKAGVDATRMDQMVTSHAIDPALLRKDDFDEFIKAREKALIDRIQKAMGKRVQDTSPAQVADDDDSDDDIQ